MYIFRKGETFILASLIFLKYEGSFGGKNRSQQIYEIFIRNSFEVREVEDINVPSPFHTIYYGLISWIRYGVFRPVSLDSLRSAGHNLYRYKKLLSIYPEVDTVLIEGTGQGVLQLVNFFKSKNRRIFFAPANLESLVPYQKEWTHRIPIINRFTQEAKLLQKSDGVFCISNEEFWLLNIFNCKAFMLPYYPPENLLKMLKERRENRSPKSDFGYLYLANFNNRPNKLGVEKFAEYLRSGRNKIKDRVHIVGYGVSKIKSFFSGIENVVFYESVSDGELNNLLKDAKACILFHYPTSGMLTRVIELILSGIPVLGNEHAIKSYQHHKNVINIINMKSGTFENQSMVEEIAYPTEDVNFFIDRLVNKD